MNDLVVADKLAPASAEEVNKEHALAQQCAGTAVQHAVRCGQLLLEVKASLQHGEFMPWIEANCAFEQSTATRYMKAAKQIATGVAISSLSGLFGKAKGERNSPTRRSRASEVEEEEEEKPANETAAQRAVYLAVFTNTSAYVVDRLTAGGQPKHCVWYKHNDREAISIHDKLGPKAIIDKGLAERVVTLRPPNVRLGQTGAAGRAPRERNPSVAGPNKKTLTTGARKRAQAAGILVIP